MLLIDNINIIRQAWPQTWEELKSIEKDMNTNLLEIEETRAGHKTLLVKQGDRATYFHSKYNPIIEGKTIIGEYKDIEKETAVIFYGVGLGYHIDAFLKENPNVDFYLYEPIPEIILSYLSYKPLSTLPIKNLKGIIIGTESKKISSFLNNLIDKNRGNVILIELPIHKKIFPTEYDEFTKFFTCLVQDKRSELHTNYAFQKRWIINSMKNLGEVISTPNIILENKGKFRDKPVILVAAGPSLNEEIENIRNIKDKGLAYIFSVGSAINTLLYNDIYPDATCTYDPTVGNQKVLAKVKELGIKDIPMIFGSSVGYETLEGYPGDKFHMITSQDTVANYFLKTDRDNRIDIVLDAPSIAVVTLQLLYVLGFRPIILVGQNLAFKDNERHSEGVLYSKEVTEQEIEDGIWVKDVYGNDVLTNEGFNRMRLQMELYIKALPSMEVINTTKNGAHIEGSTFMELKEVIEEYLAKKVVDKNWLYRNEINYDKQYLCSQAQVMKKAYGQAQKLIQEHYRILDGITRMIRNRNYNEADRAYRRLDKSLSKLEKNDFFKTFILPMNRVNYKILANSINSLNAEKNLAEKGRKIVASFENFIGLCKQNIESIDVIYEEMNNKIKNH